MAWKIFQSLWVRGTLKACVVRAKTYIGLTPLPEDGCVLTFGGLTDNPGDTGIDSGQSAWLLQDGYIFVR